MTGDPDTADAVMAASALIADYVRASLETGARFIECRPIAREVIRVVKPLIAAEAGEAERQRIRDGSDRWPGGIAGPAWYKVPAELLDGAS